MKKDRMGYGLPYHLLSEEERAARSAHWVYAREPHDWVGTDLPGRRPPRRTVPQGPHQPLPGRALRQPA